MAAAVRGNNFGGNNNDRRTVSLISSSRSRRSSSAATSDITDFSDCTEIDMNSKNRRQDLDLETGRLKRADSRASSRMTTDNGGGQFVQDDSGSVIMNEKYGASASAGVGVGVGGTKTASAPAQILDKTQLDRRSGELCRELRTTARLTEEFRNDVADEKIADSDLLRELELKIKPFLIRLDEEIAQQADLVRINLDRCRITDHRVDWLLRYNQYMLEFRRLIERLTTKVYDELERLLRLKVRGAYGAMTRYDLSVPLSEITKSIDQIETAVTAETNRPDRLRSSPSVSTVIG